MSDEKKIEEAFENIFFEETEEETTAARIARIRKRSGLSQEEFAQRIMVTRAAVSKWENGGGMPSVDSCQIIAREFNISVDYILGVSDYPFAKNKSLFSSSIAPKTKTEEFFAKVGYCCIMPAIFAVTASLSWASEGVDFVVPFTYYATTPLVFFAMFGIPTCGFLPKKWKTHALVTSALLSLLTIFVLSILFVPAPEPQNPIFSPLFMFLFLCGFGMFIGVLIIIGIFRYKKLERAVIETEGDGGLEES